MIFSIRYDKLKVNFKDVRVRERFMNGFEKIIYSIQAELAETPMPFGLFHLTSFALTILLTVFLCVKFKNADKKAQRKLLLVASLIMLFFEVYKQTVFSFSYDGEKAVWDYQWYAFPFQFCSTPMYIMFIASFTKNEKIFDALSAYIASFTLFAGLCVMVYPNTVYIRMIGIDVQTMLHHGFMVVFGTLMIVINRKRLNVKFFMKGVAVFVSLVGVALILDMTVPAHINGETFNMFFISPKFDCSIPILDIIYTNVPYPVFLASYLFGFSFCAFIILGIGKGITYYVLKSKKYIFKKSYAK